LLELVLLVVFVRDDVKACSNESVTDHAEDTADGAGDADNGATFFSASPLVAPNLALPKYNQQSSIET